MNWINLVLFVGLLVWVAFLVVLEIRARRAIASIEKTNACTSEAPKGILAFNQRLQWLRGARGQLPEPLGEKVNSVLFLRNALYAGAITLIVIYAIAMSAKL